MTISGFLCIWLLPFFIWGPLFQFTGVGEDILEKLEAFFFKIQIRLPGLSVRRNGGRYG